MWLLMSVAWLLGVGLCLAVVIGGLWQYPPLAVPLLYLGWRGVRWVQRVAHGVREIKAQRAGVVQLRD